MHTSFSRLAWSNLAAQLAEQIGLTAVPIVAVFAFGAGASATGLLQTAQTLPFLLLAIPAGVLADRLSRTAVMVAGESLRVASLGAIMWLAYVDGLSLFTLALLGFLGTCGTVFYSVVAPSLVPELVPPAQLPSANARIELARTIAFAAGPASAGALIGWLGVSPAFAMATVLSCVSVLLLCAVREPPRSRGPSKSVMSDVLEGTRFVFQHRLLRPVFLTQVTFNTAFFVLQAVYIPYAVSVLGLSAAQIGITLALYGAGMVCGALLAPFAVRFLRFGIVVCIGPVCGVAGALAMLGTIALPSASLAAASYFVIGAGSIVWVISTTTLRQAVTPAALLGRVSAVNIMAYGARPLGSALGALTATIYGAEACLVLGAVLFIGQALIIVRPMSGLQRPC